MKASAASSKAATTKAKSKTKVDVPAMPVTTAKAAERRPTAARTAVWAAVSAPMPQPARRSRTQADVALPMVVSPALESAGTSKQARLISLMSVPSGATIDQMMTLTGWQAHTVRGAISGVLRKRLGLNVVCAGAAGSRSYRIVAA